MIAPIRGSHGWHPGDLVGQNGGMNDRDYDTWFAELRRLAEQRDIAWMIQTDAATHRDAFAKGLSPDEEMTALTDMAEWRGCGCGGGG